MQEQFQGNGEANIEDRDLFDRIAPGWYGFRHRSIFSTELEQLCQQWGKGKLLNLGCAHGPDFLPFKDSFELHGVDFSMGMLKLAARYSKKFSFSVDLVAADIRCLPYADETFDWAISVATYHHLRDAGGRLKAFQELNRVLKPGAEAFVTVWNRWQPRFFFAGNDVLVPWRSHGGVLQRYYHLFSYHELEDLSQKAGFKVLKSFPESKYRFPIKWFSRNICLLIKKAN